MERRVILGIAVAVLVVIATVAAVEYIAPPSNAGRWGQSDGIWIAVYNGLEVNFTIQHLRGFLEPGDGIALVMHNASNWSLDAYFAGLLHAAFPGVTLRAYMSLDGGTGEAGGLATTISQLSPLFTQASADWEINGPVEFNASYAATLDYFEEFAKIVRDSGRLAIGYPSGRGVLGDYSGPPYRWNYGTFATALDGMTVETQGICGNASQWDRAMSVLWGQYNASGQSTSTLSVQISLGNGGNGVNDSDAAYCGKEWRSLDHGNLFFFWGVPQEPELVTVLTELGR